jgi:hypothetical protein
LLYDLAPLLVAQAELLQVVRERAVVADLHLKHPAEVGELLVQNVAHHRVEGEGQDRYLLERKKIDDRERVRHSEMDDCVKGIRREGCVEKGAVW